MSARGCVFGRYTTPTIIVLGSFNLDFKKYRFYNNLIGRHVSHNVNLLFINNPTPPDHHLYQTLFGIVNNDNPLYRRT